MDCCNCLRLAPVICAGINLNLWERGEDTVRVLPQLTASQAGRGQFHNRFLDPLCR
jgi:hypothetical protein